MITVTINGKKKDREFQNMAQALAFAYQNGECYGAETVELALDGKGIKSDQIEPEAVTEPEDPKAE